MWTTLFMMLCSAVVGASTDARFTWNGYSWQLANCLFTSAYALYLRSTMDKVGSMLADDGDRLLGVKRVDAPRAKRRAAAYSRPGGWACICTDYCLGATRYDQ